MSPLGTDPGEVAAALRELRQVQRQLNERELVRRSDALDEIEGAVEQLAEIGSAAAILDRAAETLGRNSRFQRALVSQVDGDRLTPRSFWARSGSVEAAAEQLGSTEIALRYPLVEAEIVAQRSDVALAVDAGSPRSPKALRELIGWQRYVVAPLRLHETVIGLLHAEPDAGGDPELKVAEIYAKGLASAFERAVLRESVQRHREELRAAVKGIADHLDENPGFELALPQESASGSPGEGENLTRRESEILKMLGTGQTNASIATSLLISESTVKFHVKNILSKLGASSRADAVARHLRGGG